ncbi:MAG: YiiX/YebB-like N1pC/P60 family cysteine hydrolase [Myxococcota bacterium]
MPSLALALVLAAAPGSSADVYALPAETFIETAKHDLATLQQFVGGMQSVMKRVRTNRALFTSKQDSVFSPEQKRTLLSTWGSLFAYFSATEGLRQKYWKFVTLPPTDSRHAWGFVLTHTALTALLANGLEFTALTLNNKQIETLLDEANEEFGVPKGAFADFKLTSVHVATSTQLMTGDSWAPAAKLQLKLTKALNDTLVKWAWDEMQKDSKAAKEALLKKGLTLYAGNAVDVVKDTSAHAIFPVQKSFAEWAGDTRVARVGKPLITADDVAKLVLPKLQPGDIIVTRQNWFLSNIGLPGFWPHAELFVGTAQELSATFDLDPEVSAWTKAQKEKAATFTELLRKRYPAKWKVYAEGRDFQGHGPIRVIESISEGVSFTAIEHAFGVDYLAAMRPRRAPLDKAKAIERAFNYQGRPYDFDFDFFSDRTLVCTELVYKAYQPGADLKGVQFDLVDVAGRRTLPANELVKRFDSEADREDRQLDFVVFIDAREKDQRAYSADAATFRASWKRLKWDIAQR